jgi:hypothetical protein
MKPTNKTLLVVNVLGFNAAWWACLLGAKYSVPWLGPLIMAYYLLFHFRYLGYGNRELLFILIIAVAGTFIDGMKFFSGFITYKGGWSGIEWLAPLWITAMWAGFAALVNHSLKWLKRSYILAFALGAIFGPPSYLAGVRFEVLEFNLSNLNSVLLLSAIWGTAILTTVWLSNRMKLGVEHA